MTIPGQDFFFELESLRSLGVREQLLAWAERVFAEPKVAGQVFDPQIYNATGLSQDQQTQLYTNFQARDSELGIGLVNWHKGVLSQVANVVRSTLAKRYTTISVIRTRIDSIDKLNEAEPNPQLRYSPAAVEEFKAELEQLNQEISYLKAKLSQIQAFEYLLKTASTEPGQVNSRITAQVLRAFWQSWRGFISIRTTTDYFRRVLSGELRLSPHNLSQKVNGYLISLGDRARKVLITGDTVQYIICLLKVIESLAAETVVALQNPETLEKRRWYPVATLVRAIVEYLHFCNFEMPIFYIDIVVDPDNLSASYRRVEQHWQLLTDQEATPYILKRIAASSAQMLVEETLLLECQDSERLERFLKYEAPKNSASEPIEGKYLQPFVGCGLADMNADPGAQQFRSQNTLPSLSMLTEQLIANQKGFERLCAGKMGSTLDTLIGMALLDPIALEIPTTAIKGLDRFHFLSDFWRAVGRRRAIGLLGEDYVRQVTVGLQAIGQNGPNHPTFLTMKIPSAGITRDQPLTDAADDPNALPGLSLTEQMRIIDLINISWALADDFMLSLREMRDENALAEIVGGFPRVVDSYRRELIKRFDERWLTSLHWIWAMIRGMSPILWDFWGKLGAERPWDSIIAQAPAPAALGLILRFFCDIVRLVLLLELSGTPAASSLRISAEPASQMVIFSVEQFYLGSNTSPFITESVDYYFDAEIQFDSWLAFVSSYKAFLTRSIKDLHQMNASVEHWRLLENIKNELEHLYPTRVVASPPPQPATSEHTLNFLSESPTKTEALQLIDEADADAFYKVCFELLGTSDPETGLFLSLLSMFRNAADYERIRQGAQYKDIIENLLPEYDYRRLLYSLPSRADSFFRLLKKLESEGRASDVALKKIQVQVVDYFEQLNDAYKATVARFTNCTNLLPQESVDLLTSEFNRANITPVLHSFLMLSVCGRVIIYLDAWARDEEYDEAKTLAKVRNSLQTYVGNDLEDPLVELFILGSGQLAITQGRSYIYSSSRLCEPAFVEPHRVFSRLLLSRFIANKFALAFDVFSKKFPTQMFVVQP